jgi:predicted permease
MLAKLRSYTRNLRRRTTFEDGLDDEIRFHIDCRTADLVRRGLSPTDAARQARLEFGSIEKHKDLARAGVGIRMLDDLIGDLRYAMRTFVRNKAFAATAILTLALGIGANTAIFSLMDALVLRWLPVYRPQDLLQVKLAPPGNQTASGTLSYPLAVLFNEQKDVFAGAAGFSANAFTVGSGQSMARVQGAIVTGAFYETLGVRPAVGRLLAPADDAPGAPLAVVLSYGYWERVLGSDPGAVGRAILLNGVPADVIGVSARGFTGANVGRTADVTIAVAALPRLGRQAAGGNLGVGNEWLRILARPRPGVSRTEAIARLSARWPQISAPAIGAQWPGWRKRAIADAKIVLDPGGTGWTGLRARYVKPLRVLMGIVLLVLLIACANVASLMLARATARRKEIAVRLAIGAGRARLVRQLLVESAALSAIGAAAGLLLAASAGRLIVSVISTAQSPIEFDLTPNWHVLVFVAAVTSLTTLIFGIAPALQSTSAEPGHSLKDDVRTGTARSRLLPSLVAAQIALSLMLLIGAGLFVRTLRNLETVDPGFRTEGILLADLDQRSGGVSTDVLDGVRRIPGVISASMSTHTPLDGWSWGDMAVPAGQPLPDRDTTLFVGASPDFFRTLDIHLLAGREFSARDTRASTPVAIVNEVYAARYFPRDNPIGRHLTAIVRSEPRDLEIVGVARGTSVNGLRKSSPLTVYVPYAQLTGDVPTTVAVRAAGSFASVASEMTRMLQPLLPNAPLQITPLSSQVAATLTQERMMALLGAGFGLLALALAAIGIYGLLAYAVTQRTRELGIRMALGARRSRVVALVLRGALTPVVVGTAAGLAGASALSRLVESMLFGLKPMDPVATGGAILVLVVVAYVAAYLPARRAAQLDPLIALRAD